MEVKCLVHSGVKGMRWGVRRYQNPDGSLTQAGQSRYARDQRENAGKKKGEKVGQADPNRWVREDLDRSKRAVTSAKDLARDLGTLNKQTTRSTRKKMDLSKMSDQEMRQKINRELLERQYSDVFNPKKVSKGREYAGKALEVTGSVLGVGASALGIALAIKELKG